MSSPAPAHFSPCRNGARPCWHCSSFERMEPAGTALCRRPGGSRRTADPAGGCVFWEREPGADDEPDALPEHARPHAVYDRARKAADPTPINVPVAWAP